MADDTTATGNSDEMLNAIIQQLLGKQTGGNALTDVGQVLGNAAAGRASGVNAANTTALAGGALGNNLFQSAMQRTLAQAALPNFRAQQAVTGDQIANTQDVVPTGPANVMAHVVNFTGGRRPSNLGPNARSAGAALSGIGASNIGKDVLPAVPTMPKLSDGGALGNALGGGALGASLLSAAMGGGKSGGGGNLGDLIKGIKNLFNRNSGNVSGTDFGSSDNIPWNLNGVEENYTPGPEAVTPGLPGSEIDPMAAYYEWLQQQQQGGGGGMGDAGPDDNTWHP